MPKANDIDNDRLIGGYVRYLADHMRLRDWTFDVVFDDSLADSIAAIECLPNRRHAILAVGDMFMQASPADQRHGIVHELTHCHLDPARTFFSTLSPIHGVMGESLRQNHDNHLEAAADALATAIAAALPTPFEYRKIVGVPE